jgi:hypothetical protein
LDDLDPFGAGPKAHGDDVAALERHLLGPRHIR